jgi:hypothetical protein
VSDELISRLTNLRSRLHADESDGSKNVHWHPDGFTVNDAIDEIVLLKANLEEASTARAHWNHRAQEAEVECLRLRDALKWYGSASRNALTADSGELARATLKGNTDGKAKDTE